MQESKWILVLQAVSEQEVVLVQEQQEGFEQHTGQVFPVDVDYVELYHQYKVFQEFLFIVIFMCTKEVPNHLCKLSWETKVYALTQTQ